MASSRKKQDEKNMKTLRDLASLPYNKYCFDCNQRGPTYVNVTIGSFVCTKCSGILRGLTPPHRVKSISMATFTPEEVELLRNRGNDYCRRTWLGLYEGTVPSERKEEQVVRDFMVDKYERKRFYLDPSIKLSNGVDAQTSNPSVNNKSTLVNSKLSQVNGASSEIYNKNGKMNDFIADFGSADIYNAINANKDNNMNSNTQASFANFDNKLFLNNVETTSKFNDDSDWYFANFDTAINQTPLFPKCNVNNFWNAPSLTTNVNNAQPQLNNIAPPAPPADRYAALKDLDNAFKSQTQTQLDWSSTGSNGSPFSSGTPNSVYSSPSPHGSMYGSPSQGQFASLFVQQDTTKVSNPFNGGMAWGDTGNNANPFRTANKVNGVNNGFYQQPTFMSTNGNPWMSNPFSMGSSASNGHSNNPFL